MAEPHLTRRQREDPLIIAWLRAQEWAEANARLLAIVAATVLVVVIAALLWTRSKAEAEGKASGQLAEISTLYWQGQYDRVLQGAEEVRRTYGGTSAATEALRIKGDALFWQGEFKRAAETYEAYLKEVKKPSPLRLGVRRNLAQAYESDRQYKVAGEIYEELAKEPGPRELRADLLLAAGRAWLAAGDANRAVGAFGQVSRDYADTPSGAAAAEAQGEIQLKDP